MIHDEKIFSGDYSRKMWDLINALKDEYSRDYKAWEAIYTLACRCQELEAKIDKIRGS
jgi:hypothetical protein